MERTRIALAAETLLCLVGVEVLLGAGSHAVGFGGVHCLRRLKQVYGVLQ